MCNTMRKIKKVARIKISKELKTGNMLNPKIFKSYDIRGIYPAEITGETAYEVGKALPKMLTSKTAGLLDLLKKTSVINEPSKWLDKEISSLHMERGWNIFKENYSCGVSRSRTLLMQTV